MCFTVEGAGRVDLPANQRKELAGIYGDAAFFLVTVLKAFGRAEKRYCNGSVESRLVP
jgi:hypothetical protein